MLTLQSVTKWQACPFISVHVSRQLDNQPLQWKSIVLIGLYLLYNSPAGNPWWQIISAPVFDWCFDVSDLQGQTEELVEALLTESNLALPRLTPSPKPEPSVRLQAASQNSFSQSEFTAAHTGHPASSQAETQADRSEEWLPVKVTVCLRCLDLRNAHMPIQAWHNKSYIRYHTTFFPVYF